MLVAASVAALFAAVVASGREDPSIARRNAEAVEARALAPLQAIEKFGYEIGKPTRLHFFVSAPEESTARKIADELKLESESTQVWFDAGADSKQAPGGDDRWHVRALLPLVLSVEGIDKVRQRLEALAAAGGARYDGWGIAEAAH